MNRTCRWLVSAALVGTLAAPVAVRAYPQEGREERERREQAEHRRVYDRDRKDWHDWDNREDARYRQWLADNHRRYRDIDRLNRKQQAQYWHWRHEQQEREAHH